MYYNKGLVVPLLFRSARSLSSKGGGGRAMQLNLNVFGCLSFSPIETLSGDTKQCHFTDTWGYFQTTFPVSDCAKSS